MIENKFQINSQVYNIENTSVLRYTRIAILYLLAISWVFQIFIDDVLNAVCATTAFITSCIVVTFTFRTNVFNNAVLPSFVVLSFNLSLLSGPLIFQSLYLKPITYNLVTPFDTMFFSSLFQMILLLVLLIYSHSKEMKNISNFFSKKILKPIGIMSVPNNKQLWLMGLVGFLAVGWKASTLSTGGVEIGDASGQFLGAFRFFSNAPFLIPILNKLSPENVRWNSNQKKFMIIYFFALLFLSMASNSRSVFATGVIIILFIYAIYTLLGLFVINKKIFIRILSGLLVFSFLMPIFSDFAIAMLLARGDRSKVSSSELIEKTIDAFQDKKAIENKKLLDSYRVNGLQYNEAYIDNIFLSRLLYVKFFDNCFSLPRVMNGDFSEKIISLTTDYFFAILPTPILRILGIDIDKNKLAFSIGDYLHTLEGVGNLGEYKVGSSVVHGFSMFSWLIFLLMIPMYLIFFILINSFSLGTGKNTFISPVIMLQLFILYIISQNDNFFGVTMFMIRGLIQLIFLYLIVFYITKIFTKYKISFKR